MIYLDSCALVKLVLPEAESQALQKFLDRHAENRQLSSALVRTELRRVLLRRDAQQHRFDLADRLLAALHLIVIDQPLLDVAGMIPGKSLRSLDTIHLATAEMLRPRLEMFVTYDKRLAEAAAERGLPVSAPQ